MSIGIQGSSSLAGNAEPADSPSKQALIELECNISTIEEDVSRLIGKLVPVLIERSKKESEPADKVPRELASPITEQLRTYAIRLDKLHSRFRTLLSGELDL